MTRQDGALAIEQVEHQTLESILSGSQAGKMKLSESGKVHQGTLFQVLPRSLFLEQLTRERMRTDRSNLALSLMVLEVHDRADSDSDSIQSLLTLLRKSLREVDSVGLLDVNVLAVMLPDTNREGAEIVARKILTSEGCPLKSIREATYPDALFESLQPIERSADDLDPALFLTTQKPRPLQSRVKRFIDIVGALIGGVVMSPVMLVTALTVKLTSPGPVIFKQIRLGKDLVPFTFYKFRSMRTDADDSAHKEYLEKLIKGDIDEVDQDSNEKTFYKMKADPRVTSVGRFIRKVSIDELPQLLNVLKGEMSLVGPRPPIPYEAENYQSWHLRRILEVKPGLTGLWQVEGRSETTFDEMVRLDLLYSREWSLLMDVNLIFRTVRVVIEGRGAA